MQNVWYGCCFATVDYVSAQRGHNKQLVWAQNADEEEDTSPKAANVGCLQWGAFWFHIQQDEEGCGWKISVCNYKFASLTKSSLAQRKKNSFKKMLQLQINARLFLRVSLWPVKKGKLLCPQ